jgi:hypothetical protein
MQPLNPPNPLQRYFRQPKVYISLPSKGLYYPEGAFHGDYNNVPVFAMNGMDEILYKTPDALFSGEATIKVIESCCPYVKDASNMPTLDVDALIIAIRIATFGEKMSVKHTCGNCGTENDYDVDLRTLLEYFNSLAFENKIQIGDLTVTIRPLTYNELTQINIENFKMQKMLVQLNLVENEEEKQRQIDAVYKKLAELQTDLFINSIESVQIPEGIVDEKDWIAEWVKNSERELYAKIKEKLEANKKEWEVPKQKVTCGNCGTEDSFEITLDQANFFVRA